MPEPQEKGVELLSRLRRLVQEEGVTPTDKVEPLQLRQIRKEAEGLLKDDPFKARVVLGAYYGYRRNYEDSLANHRLAVELNPGDWVANFNYGVDLTNFGDFVEAESLFSALAEAEPADVGAASAALTCAVYSLQFHKFARHLAHLKKIAQPEDVPTTEVPQFLRDQYEQEGVSDEDGAEVYQAARRILRDKGIHTGNVWFSPSQGLGVYWIQVQWDPQEVAALSEELAFALADLEAAPKVLRLISLTYSASLPSKGAQEAAKALAE